MLRYLLIGVAALVLPGGLLLLAIAIGRRFAVRSQEPAIPPLSREHYRFIGHDEALAVRTLARRAEAEELKRRARQIETRARHGMRRVH